MFGKSFRVSAQHVLQYLKLAGFCLIICLLTPHTLWASDPAPGTVVTTEVTASYVLADSTGETSQSNDASFIVGKTGSVSVLPTTASQAASSGQTVCAFPLQIQNTGLSSDQFSANITAPAGWNVSLVQDSNGDGNYQPSETALMTLPLALDAGQSVLCFLRVTCPAGLDSGGTVSVHLTSQADSTKSAQFTGTLTAAPAPPAALHLGWSVQTGGPVMGEATLHGGIAYIGSDDGCLYAIAATPASGASPGTVLWQRQTNGRVRCTPAVYVSPDGRELVSAGNDAGRLTTWDAATGAVLWSVMVSPGHSSSWRTRPLISPDSSLITVLGIGASLSSLTTNNGILRRRAPWRDLTWVGNPTVSDADGGAWLMAANGWGTEVCQGLPGRRVWLGKPGAGALALDTAQNCLVGVTVDGHIAAFDASSLLPDPQWPAGAGIDLNVSVPYSPALDSANGILYVAAADHVICAVRTADGAAEPTGWPFAPNGAAGTQFRASPLPWPSQDGVSTTVYAGDTGGAFYAVPAAHPDQALVFKPDFGSLPLGEWDAAPAASGTGPQDVVVAGNSNGGVYGFLLR